MRRVRQFEWSRRLVAEHRLSVNDLIWPVFVQPGKNRKTEIESMPGVFRMSQDQLAAAAKEAHDLGIPALAVFPETDLAKKTPGAEEAINPDNLVCQTVAAIKQAVPEIGIICDVAFDPYTSHGQDGLVRDGIVVNDESVQMLCEQAIVQAAGWLRHHRSVGHDGWTYRRDSHCPGSSGLGKHHDYVLRRQVCLRILWTVSRRDRFQIQFVERECHWRRKGDLSDESLELGRSHS